MQKFEAMKRKRAILVPTAREIEPFRRRIPETAEIVVTGIGPHRCATATVEAILCGRYDRLILSGIAGAYPGCGLSTGDVVFVESERCAGLGSWSEGAFAPKFAETYRCPYIPENLSLRSVRSNSAEAACAPYIDRNGVQIENMEGAAFFHACLRHGMPFAELRAISNIVGEPFGAWRIPQATEALADALERLLIILNEKA